jgi:transcriptional regulator of acetoin/glycerol metabolism
MRQTRSNVGREVASLERTERDAVLMALHQCAGNIAATARQLGVGRPTLYRKMRKYNIEVQGVKTIF